MDRVTHRLDLERGPIDPQPVDVQAWGGVAYYFDDNIYLEDGDEDDSSIIVPFVRGRLTYQEMRLEAELDVLANHNFVIDETNETDDEQRAYGRIRQIDSNYFIEVAQLFQHVSAPLDVQFSDRADRFISNSSARFSYDISKETAVEGEGHFGVVRYEDEVLAHSLDNINGRVHGGLVWHGLYGYDYLVQAGYFAGEYLNDQTQGAPPEYWGYYFRGGMRGQILPRLWVEALVGYTEVETDYFLGTTIDEDDSTADARVQAKYEASETVNLFANYRRFYTFAGSVDPYQLINRFNFIGEFALTEQIDARLRAQYDFADTASGIERSYIILGGSVSYSITPNIILDGGGFFRTGETEGAVVQSSEFDNFVVHVGLALTY